MEPFLLWALRALLTEVEQSLSPSPAFSEALQHSTSSTGNTAPVSSAIPSSIADAINASADKTGLSPALLKAVAFVESGFNPEARSTVGAIGVMQLMPGTANELGVNPFNAAANIEGGAQYLKSLLDTFHGNMTLALAAYNAGPGAVEHYGGVPPYQQTQSYVQKVLDQYRRNLRSTPTGGLSND